MSVSFFFAHSQFDFAGRSQTKIDPDTSLIGVMALRVVARLLVTRRCHGQTMTSASRLKSTFISRPPPFRPVRPMEAFVSSGIASGATNAGLPSAEVESVKVAVLAAGAFGIAMATLAARRKHDVVIYARDAAVVRRPSLPSLIEVIVLTSVLLGRSSRSTRSTAVRASSRSSSCCRPSRRRRQWPTPRATPR